MVEGTGVYLPEDQKASVKEEWLACQQTPFMAARFGPQDDTKRRESFMKRLHELALSAGLPEIEGGYGVNMETGEFLRQQEPSHE